MKNALALGAAALVASVSAGFAVERGAKSPMVVSGGALQQTDGRYYRKRAAHPQHFAGRRIGFYSYTYRDVINTYGMSRSLYGSMNSFRDPYVDRQTPSGPFDHGFFFDSGNMPHGGNSPYMN